MITTVNYWFMAPSTRQCLCQVKRICVDFKGGTIEMNFNHISTVLSLFRGTEVFKIQCQTFRFFFSSFLVIVGCLFRQINKTKKDQVFSSIFMVILQIIANTPPPSFIYLLHCFFFSTEHCSMYAHTEMEACGSYWLKTDSNI